MNILFITDLYPLQEDDYTSSKALKDYVDEFFTQGHRVQVIRPNFLLNSFLRKKKFYKTGFYENIYNVNYLTPFLFDVKKKLCEINPYDVIVSHMPSGNIFSNNFEGKLFCGVHNSDIKVLINPLYSIYFKQELLKAFRRADKLLCRSFKIEIQLLYLYPEFKGKTEVIFSGVPEETIIKRTPDFGEKIKILSCANLIKRKNIDKLINACKNLNGIELTIIGDGEEFENLKKLDENVIFKGRLEHEKVIEEMQKSDIFILPSVDETFGLVYLEAMASGCIVVGTQNEGIEGFIKDEENGFLTQPDTASIRKLILKIKNLDLYELHKISQNCYNTIKSFDRTASAKRYLSLIGID